jgi:4-hydroxy-2-oxoheptanedioate aldolase
MSSILKERLAAGHIVRSMVFTGFSNPRVVEMAGRLGNFHCMWFDQEHAAIPQTTLELMLIAARAAGKEAFARVPPTDYATVMRPMEAGANGIMVAQIRTIDEVREVVEWAKYPPVGKRGFFGGNVECDFGMIEMARHVACANNERWLAIQIETPEAVEIVEQIATTEGVDWLFVGPADLSVTLGVPGEFLHPHCIDAMKRVASATKKAGKTWGTLSRDVAHARACRELGAQFFAIYADVDCIRAGLRTIEERFADFME